MDCVFCSWEFAAFIGFLFLWKFSRSLQRIKEITSRHVFITGCDTGFGRLLAESLDKKGVHVYAGCLTDHHAAELKEKSSSRLKTVHIDVTDSKSVRRAAEYVKADLDEKGGAALWGIVNNAGIADVRVPFEWSTKEDCRKVLDVNLLGVYDVTLAFLPLIKRGKEGRIVNISSIFGRVGHLIGGYALSKYGIEAFSDGLSGEVRPYNITVHTLNPGFFKTNLPDKDIGEKLFRKRYSELSEEIQQQYGGEEYAQKFSEFWGKYLDSVISPKLHLVIEAYEHALLAKYPQNRYAVGSDYKFFYQPLSFLPYNWQVIILDFMMKRSGVVRPLPKDVVTIPASS